MLLPLQRWRQHGHEIILVGGGGDNGAEQESNQLVDDFIYSTPGRARQMNAGAAKAKGEVLLFLHSDTDLPEMAEQALLRFNRAESAQWGFFDLHLSGRQRVFRIIEMAISWRASLTGIATGDQAIFIRKQVFRELKGFADIPLMEDIEISQRLKKRAQPVIPAMAVCTSSRRWERNGVLKTVLLMWFLRLGYFLGVSPVRLARVYYSGTDFS